MDAGHLSMADITGSISPQLAAKGVNYYAHTNSLLIIDLHCMTTLFYVHKPRSALNFSH